jgi:hypothetical protein
VAWLVGVPEYRTGVGALSLVAGNIALSMGVQMRLIGFVLVALIATTPAFAQSMGYAGQQTREIKSLSADDTADLLAGRGMGMARAAELNHYPGPAHLLELKDKLGLTPAQIEIVQASFARMSAAARPLGAELVDRERALDRAFKDGSIKPEVLVSETAAIGALQGRLRAVHLAAHLETKSILTQQQIDAYDRLRGYADGGQDGHHHGMHHG